MQQLIVQLTRATVTFWGPGIMLCGLSCLPLTAPQPASSLGSTNRLSFLSDAMPSTTGAASAATAGAAMCSSGCSIFREAEGTAAGSNSRLPPAALRLGHGMLSSAWMRLFSKHCHLDASVYVTTDPVVLCQHGAPPPPPPPPSTSSRDLQLADRLCTDTECANDDCEDSNRQKAFRSVQSSPEIR